MMHQGCFVRSRALFFTSFLFLFLFHFSVNAHQLESNDFPHLDLEMSVSEMKRIILMNKSFYQKLTEPTSIAQAIEWGERLSKWIAKENEGRTAENQLQLSQASLRRGFPIDGPSIYSDKTVATDLGVWTNEAPASMRTVIEQSRSKFPNQLPVSDEIFLTFGRRLNRIYQSAVRFKMLGPYRVRYTALKKKDVRGFYFLKTNQWTADRLDREFSDLLEAQKNQVAAALVGICINSKGMGVCEGELKAAITEGSIGKFFETYYNQSQKMWDNFFKIPSSVKRNDVVWNSQNPHRATVPFNTPKQEKIKNYLKVNIEDEWRWENGGLKIQFGSFANGPRITFQAGVTPHVNGLGGNEIVMDANEPIEEYESKWTIRHEFGHVLGYPDCYHEFYDPDLMAYVNYQLDVSDLMCSRAGNMKERIYQEFKRVYFQD